MNPAAGASASRAGRTRIRARRRAGFTLIEVATTVAVLIIVLGLMVSLARQVRKQAGMTLTKDLLRRLDAAMAQYALRNGDKLPVVAAFPPPANTGNTNGVEAVVTGAGDAVAQTRPALVTPPRNGGEVAAAGPAEENEPIPDHRALLEAARANNRDFVAALKAE